MIAKTEVENPSAPVARQHPVVNPFPGHLASVGRAEIDGFFHSIPTSGMAG
jgi:hypothetical protein